MRKTFFAVIFILSFITQFYSYGQATDPHRGLTVTKLIRFTPASINSGGTPIVDISNTILGTPREDSLLSYCRDNHITYLELYDMYLILRYDTMGCILPSGDSLVEGLCNFINKAKNQYCISEVGAATEKSFVFGRIDSLNQSPIWYSPALILNTIESQTIANPSFIHQLLTTTFLSTDSLFALSIKLKQLICMFRFNSTCTAHFDFFNVIDEELWHSTNPNYYFNNFLPLMHYVDSLKNNYNAMHTDSVRIAVYIRALTGNTRDTLSVNLIDGFNSAPPIADRVLAVHYGANPYDQYFPSSWQGEMKLFNRPSTKPKTDYHP